MHVRQETANIRALTDANIPAKVSRRARWGQGPRAGPALPSATGTALSVIPCHRKDPPFPLLLLALAIAAPALPSPAAGPAPPASPARQIPAKDQPGATGRMYRATSMS